MSWTIVFDDKAERASQSSIRQSNARSAAISTTASLQHPIPKHTAMPWRMSFQASGAIVSATTAFCAASKTISWSYLSSLSAIAALSTTAESSSEAPPLHVLVGRLKSAKKPEIVLQLRQERRMASNRDRQRAGTKAAARMPVSPKTSQRSTYRRPPRQKIARTATAINRPIGAVPAAPLHRAPAPSATPPCRASTPPLRRPRRSSSSCSPSQKPCLQRTQSSPSPLRASA